MPNAKGGKGYKKGKHDDSEKQLLECNESENQMYGRAMKSLGNRRFRIFCNDNKERICRVCGSMRKSEWIEPGSLVLISVRELSMSTVHGKVTEDKEVYIGDIIGLIDPSLVGKMKKLPNVNPILFTNVETRDKTLLNKSIKAQEDGVDEVDDFFSVDSHEDEDEDEDDTLEAAEEKAARKEKKKAKEQEISSARNIKNTRANRADDDIDIDRI
jgi:initiation factor 1A